MSTVQSSVIAHHVNLKDSDDDGVDVLDANGDFLNPNALKASSSSEDDVESSSSSKDDDTEEIVFKKTR